MLWKVLLGAVALPALLFVLRWAAVWALHAWSARCIFCEIAAGRAKARVIHSSEHVVVFEDIDPAADVHYLAVPREHHVDVRSLPRALRARVLEEGVAAVRAESGLARHELVCAYTRPFFVSVRHAHLHVMSRARPTRRVNALKRWMSFGSLARFLVIHE